MEDETPVLLVTANVGSIFEEPDTMLSLWVQEFLQTVVRFNAKFVALHCQEVGGKNYEIRMQHVSNFLQMLVSSEELQLYDKAEIFIDEDFSCAENFTALGNFYFVHQTVTDILIWNFEDQKFQNLNGRNVHSGNIEDVSIKEKSKFPQNFFPECKWSRKGYLRTRWNVNGSVFDLVNIHLFHDASNFVAMQTFPSVYTVTRQRALQYTLNKFYTCDEKSTPFFLFGDFNFRTDTLGVIKKLTSGLSECRDAKTSTDDEKVEYKDDASEVIITIGKKEFSHFDHQNVFVNDSGEWLKEYDREMEAFKDQLFEYPIQFLPSYPFVENNSSCGRMYMKTRCPAWCDRVLLSVNAKQLISQDDETSVEYGVIGEESCMGDHKPVYLYARLINGAGIIEPAVPIVRVCSAYCSCSACKDSQTCSSNVSSPTATSSSKKHHRSASRCLEPPMTTVTEVCCDREANDVGDADVVEGLVDVARRSPCRNFRSRSSSSSSATPSCAAESRIKSSELDRLHHFCQRYGARDFASRSFDDDTTTTNAAAVIRSNSASKVVDASWRGGKMCGCAQYTAGGWRARSVSSSGGHTSGWNSETRVRLKSDPNLKASLPRIQSHHSSSDEEWFEEVNETEPTTTTTTHRADAERERITVPKSGEFAKFENLTSAIEREEEAEAVCTPLRNDKRCADVEDAEDERRRNYVLCCIPTRWRRKNGVRDRVFPELSLRKRKYFRFLSSKNRRCQCCCVG